jgi:hypothetical protein
MAYNLAGSKNSKETRLLWRFESWPKDLEGFWILWRENKNANWQKKTYKTN